MGGDWVPMLGGNGKTVRPGTAVAKGAKVVVDASMLIHRALAANYGSVCRGDWNGATSTFKKELRHLKAWSDGTVKPFLVLDGLRPGAKLALQGRTSKAEQAREAVETATLEELGGKQPARCVAKPPGCSCVPCENHAGWENRRKAWVLSDECTLGLKQHLTSIASRQSIAFVPHAVQALKECDVPYLMAPAESEDQMLATETDVVSGHDCDFLTKQRRPKAGVHVLQHKGSMCVPPHAHTAA